MNSDKFSKIADSLRQYRRAELLDFQTDTKEEPINALYVDPLPSDAILKTVLLNNTTFIVGRKGTGKSTIFAKAQSELRKSKDSISIYVDVKSLHELLTTSEAPVKTIDDAEISETVYRAHLLRKGFLGSIIADLIKELSTSYQKSSLFDRWLGQKRQYKDAVESLEALAATVKSTKLTQAEIPILRIISAKTKESKKLLQSTKATAKIEAKLSSKPEAKGSAGSELFDESVSDNEVYKEYADAVLRSFPFQEIINQTREFLREAQLSRLFVFFDDFSELSWVDQKLFVDVILSPLNNASNETIKLKIAGYPGRIYYGKIDPGKVDTIGLDFYQLYKASDVQTSELAAIHYLERLLTTRFIKFQEKISSYFDPSQPLADYFRLIFEVTLNVPRLIGYVFLHCYLDKVSKGQQITASAIRLAAQKHYETVIAKYFDRMNRFAIEPFEQKLDRYNQQQLLKFLINAAKSVKKGITTGQVGGKYFDGLSNPPVSHFAINPSLEALLSSLESNFLVTKYHEMRDKSGKDVSIYTFFYGLCEAERIAWGYPRGRRDDRSYFVQRCFDYNAEIQHFLAQNKTIKCGACGACHDMKKKDMIEFYKWQCPECREGTCSVVSLRDDFQTEVEKLQKDTALPAVELDILEALNDEAVAMRAGDIAALVDVTPQLVGHRTAKLKDMGLVNKKKDTEGVVRSTITDKAKERYFGATSLTDSNEADT
ncbi:transcriptional regulator [Corallococcus sp. ZKHCc1 1396]|uniref:Transcriptional regulator n=2 Tax=Corallococcus soli TaxID=2710757 RepID=A0ABR9PPD0_9BACT|nr:transcriptional regulator [Corallococcus soli]